MRFHWQNLDTDQDERPKSNGWRHGRFWWTLRNGEPGKRELMVGGSWNFFSSGLGPSLYVEMDPSGDHEWTAHVGLGRLAQFWVYCNGLVPTWKVDGYASRILGVHFDDGSIRWEVWKDPHSWSREDGWRNSSWSWRDFVQGKPEYASEILHTHEHVPVPMPERSYPCRVVLTRDTWTRKRAPFGIGNMVVYRGEITPDPTPDGKPGCIPHPGKRGDDGLFGMTTQASNLTEAISAVVRSVLAQRDRYGSGKGLIYASPTGR